MSRPVDAGPFVGLRPFEQADAHLFFGRDEQVDALTARLQTRRFVAVLGTSGSGKSSLVRAGLLPALEGGRVIDGGTSWSIAIMTPGANPIGNLAAALVRAGVTCSRSGAAVNRATTLEAILRRGALGLVDAVRESRLAANDSLLVFVDQFEEIFRFTRIAEAAGGHDHAAAFVKLLLTALQQPSPAIYVMLTMRSEFLGNAAAFRDLPEAINDSLFVVPRLTRDQLTQAICGPVAVVGGRIAPSLVQRLLNDVGDDPDQLPVLQHALMRTWVEWRKNGAAPSGLTIDHYEEVRGLAGALSEHADEAFLELDERQKPIAATMFKALTERGQDGREVRRPTSIRELADVAGVDSGDIIAVVDHFRPAGRSFLVPSGTQPLTADTVIDISHESLMRKWTRLRDWIAQEAEDRRILLRLSDSAAQHAAGEEPLLRDPRLTFLDQWRGRFAPAEAWARRYAPNFNQAVTYLERSLAARQREVIRKRVLWGGIPTAIVLGGLGLLQMYYMNQQNAIDADRRSLSQQQKSLKTEQELLNAKMQLAAMKEEDEKAKEKQHEDEIQRGVEAARRVAELTEAQREAQRLALGRATEAVRADPRGAELAALVALRMLNEAERMNDAAAAKTATAALTEQIRMLPVVRLRHELGGPVSQLGASVEGILAAPSLSRGVFRLGIWRVDGERLSQVRAPERTPGSVGRLVGGALDSTGRETAWISGGTVRLWSADLGERPEIALSKGISPTKLALSSDGRYMLLAGGASGSDLWDLTTRMPKHLDAGNVDDISFSGDGRRSVTAGRGTVRLWDVETGAQIGPDVRLRDTSEVRVSALSRTGAWLAVAASNWIEVWRVAGDGSGGAAFSPVGPKEQPHTSPVTDVAFSSDEGLFASASDDGTVEVFTLSASVGLRNVQSLDQGAASVLRVVFGPDSSTPDIATGLSDGTARLWRALTTRAGTLRWTERFRVPHAGKTVRALAFLSGEHLASADESGVVRVSSWPAEAIPTGPLELMRTACTRVGRTLTADEWMSYFRLQPYESLCEFPVDSRQLLEIEIAHAHSGNAAQALQAARQLGELEDTRGLDPLRVMTAAIAQMKIQNADIAREHIRLAVRLAGAVERDRRADVSNDVCWQGSMNGFAADVVKVCDDAVNLASDADEIRFLTEAAIAYARMGNRRVAGDRFVRAVGLAKVHKSANAPTGNVNNEVCWRGAIYDFAREVRPACDAAVAASNKNAAYLDSQGIAYALIGTPDLLDKAKENFKAFVANSGTRQQQLLAKRKSWVEELEHGRNPFAPTRRASVLADLAKDLEEERARAEQRPTASALVMSPE